MDNSEQIVCVHLNIFLASGRKELFFLKSIRVSSFSGPLFPAFGLNTKRYFVILRIQSTWGKYGLGKLRIRALFTQC